MDYSFAMQNGKKKASIGPRGYPRPQLVRERWTSLNGTWQFAIDAEAWIKTYHPQLA